MVRVKYFQMSIVMNDAINSENRCFHVSRRVFPVRPYRLRHWNVIFQAKLILSKHNFLARRTNWRDKLFASR